MSARILQSIWRLQRLSGVTNVSRRLTVGRSYATGVVACNAGFHHSNKWNSSVHPTSSVSLIQPNVLVRNLSARAETEKVLDVDVLLENIESYIQRNGNMSYDNFCKLMDLLERHPDSYNQLLNESQLILLLGSCGNLLPAQTPEQRMVLFQRLWNYLENHQQLNGEHFWAALEVRRLNRMPLNDFREFVQLASQYDPKIVNGSFYEQLVAMACESGNIRQATEILGDMREKQFALTENVFNALLVGHSRNRDLAGCKTVIDSMMAANMPIGTETQSLLICAYLENAQMEQAIDLLKKFEGQFDSAQVLRMLNTVLQMDDVRSDLVEQLMRQLPSELLSGTEMPLVMKNIFIELVHIGKLDAVTTLIRALPNPEFNENQDIDTFALFMLYELFNSNTTNQRIIEMCRMLVESGKNTRALHIATEIAMRRSPPNALPFFEALAAQEPLRPHYFWPLMMYNFRRHGENGIMRTLKIMSNFQVECDEETTSYYVLPRLSITLENPLLALQSLDETGIKTSLVMGPILHHLLSQQKLEAVLEICQLYPTKIDCMQMLNPLCQLAVNVRATKRYSQFVKVIQSLVNKSDNPKVDFVGQLLVESCSRNQRFCSDPIAINRLVNEMRKYGLSISRVAADQIISLLSNCIAEEEMGEITKMLRGMCNTQLSLENNADISGSTSSFVKHPRDMTIDELECHLIELEAKGMNTRGVLRRLLQLCVRHNRLERGLEVKKKCDEKKVQVSPGMLASVFDLYIKLKDLPNAEASLKQLQSMYPGFQIDEHKILDYAALLVSENQLDAGKAVLSARAASGKVVGGNYIIKNVWNFLTSVAQLAANKSDLPREQNLTRDAFAFLQKLHFCNSQNAVLGPIVREYLLRNDLTAAVEELKKIADHYKHTPLQFELMTLLVRLCNSDEEGLKRFAITVEEAKSLLDTVTNIVSRVHGLVNMNSALVVAFAESGTEQQLRRLMIDPEFRLNEEMLVKNCEHLGKEGSVPTLIRLARATRGLNHVVSEQNIYNMLLDNFAKTNNYQAALELFEHLDEDDELKMSQDFLRNLVHLLKVNDIEIPSKLALRAQIM